MVFFCCNRKQSLKNQTDFWIVSAPGPSNTTDLNALEKTYDQLKRSTSSYSNCFKFVIPQLKISTLNQLVALSDSLAKTDVLLEGVNKKIAQYIVEMHHGDMEKADKALKINDLSMADYITRFRWDEARHPSQQNLQTICDVINEQTIKIDKEFKNRSANYSAIMSVLEHAQKKMLCQNLLTQDLETLVKPHHFVKNSEYLISYVVLIQKPRLSEWKNCYESLTSTVVPRSSRILHQDKEYFLCNVTVFKMDADIFKLKARELKFIIREYSFDASVMRESPAAVVAQQEEQLKRVFGPTLQFMSSAFAETFSSWVHIKSMRVFTESILKYGLPAYFVTAVLTPRPKKDRQVKTILYKLYERIDPLSLRNPKINNELAGLGYGVIALEYTPFVCFKFNTNIFK